MSLSRSASLVFPEVGDVRGVCGVMLPSTPVCVCSDGEVEPEFMFVEALRVFCVFSSSFFSSSPRSVAPLSSSSRSPVLSQSLSHVAKAGVASGVFCT